MDLFNADKPGLPFFFGRLAETFSILSIVIFHLQLIVIAEGSLVPILPGYHLHHPPPLHGPVRWTKPAPAQRTPQGRPVDVMTDVINDLGVRILDRYLDDAGNVGFSPSGLGFVLVALYEGSAGSSSRQIGDVLGLPRDRRITRIGLRDIHRRLRSYLNADAFLGGLTLNRDDINLRPDYEQVLRFYGFNISDSGIDVNATTMPPNVATDSSTDSLSSTAASTTPVTAADSTLADFTGPMTMQMSITAAPSSMPTTINDAVEIITDMTGGTSSALTGASSVGTSSTNATPATLVAMSQTVATTNSPSTDASNVTSSDVPPATSPMTTTSPSTTLPTSTMMDSSSVQTDATSTDAATTIAPMQRLVGASTDPADTQNQTSTMLATDSTLSPVENSPTSPMSTSVSVSMSMSTGNSDVTTANSSATEQAESSTAKAAADDAGTNSVRRRRGVPHGPAGYFSSSAEDGIWLDEFGRLNVHEDYPSQDEDIVAESRRPTEVAFLVNGCDYSRVTAAVYTAVLPFAYFPSLGASLLEFPLDDPRYKILVFLPSEPNGTRRLARLLATKPITLRHLRRSLQPNWITAVIPSFMLRGFVTLTPFLQRLGISDVFEPRSADLSPMSPDLGVYARDIQQSIGVNIRNNVKGGIGGADGGNEEQQQSQSAALVRSARGVAAALPPFFAADGAISPPTRGNYSPYPGAGNVLYEKAHPVPFVVDHPFLYFIVDDETSVTLLAGRIDDPLNSRML